MAEIYERLPGELVKAFAAFQAYRDMEGHGTYAKLAHTLGKSKSLIGRWATKWRWQERLRAYLDHLDQETLKNRDRELRGAAIWRVARGMRPRRNERPL